MNSKLYWIILVLFISATLVFDVAFVNNYFPVLKKLFPLWAYKSLHYVLSDILFLEGGMFLILGAFIAGANLSKMIVPGILKVEYTAKLILYWKLLLKEMQISPALTIGLVLIGTGIIYIVVGILITL